MVMLMTLLQEESFRSGVGYDRNAKITELDIVAGIQQHVLWLDIAMDLPVIMRVLQGLSHLLHRGEDTGRCQDGS